MKNCTIVYSFYNNQQAVDKQCCLWNSYVDILKKRICIIAVDDGSSPKLNFNIDKSISFVHLRVTEDILWNQPGAKNLAMKFVPTDWAFITDSDHLITEETVSNLLEFSPKQGTFYRVGRLKDGQPCQPHPNTFLLRKSDFFSIYGYDEDFCGNYGYDDSFFVEKIVRNHQIEILNDFVIHYESEIATTNVDRNSRTNKKLFKKKRMLLIKNRYHPPRMNRFNWEIVDSCPSLLNENLHSCHEVIFL